MSSHSQTIDKTLGGIVIGAERLTDKSYPYCEREGLLALCQTDDPVHAAYVSELRKQAVAAEMATCRELKKVLELLGGHAIPLLLFKGTALAYSIYPEAWRRFRNDTDILIREEDRPRVRHLLEKQGYVRRLSNAGELIVAEEGYDYVDEFGLLHTLDIHWRLNNSLRLASVFSFDALWEEKLPIEELGEFAFRSSNVHAAAIACVHRIAHMHYEAYRTEEFVRKESDLTLWIYDIHLLAENFSDQDWDELCSLMIEHGMGKILLSGLEQSRLVFGTDWPGSLGQRALDADGQFEVDQFASEIRAQLQSLSVLPDLKSRIRFLGQHLFPSVSYMRAAFGTGPLPVLYLRRLISGIRKRLGP